jgi:S1-C subfamily serine protease
MKTKKWYILLIIGTLVLSVLACNVSGDLTNSFTTTEEVPAQVSPLPTQSTDDPSITIIIPDYVNSQDTLVSLYQQLSPGVVSIQVISDLGAGQGSGFVIDQQGHIVTNYHVVEGAQSVEVDFSTGLKVYAEVIGMDLDSDLAVLKVNVDPTQLVPLPLGDSDFASVGQTVVAIGNPYGLSGSMTVGIISARGRILDSMRQSTDGAFFTAGDLIQTDAAINPGNSGGPLINLNGEVIGVNRAIQTESTTVTGEVSNSGIGFAISSNIVRRVVPSLIEKGSYDYPYLGLSSVSGLTLSMQEILGLTQPNGAYVTSITTGGPADKAGLKAGTQATTVQGYYAGGDLIISVDGHQVNEFNDMLSYMILNKVPGDTMTVTVLRNGEPLELVITLGKRP